MVYALDSQDKFHWCDSLSQELITEWYERFHFVFSLYEMQELLYVVPKPRGVVN